MGPFVILILALFACSVRGENPWESLLGASLYSWKDETRSSVDERTVKQALADKKVVGLYFSASWCGPCRSFTPQLAEFYKKMNKKYKGKFEIVWISGDRSEQEFVGYYQKMPWLAVPVNVASQIYQKLSPLYKVKGIPHMVFLDGEDASVYTLDGRTKVMSDPYGLEFPYRPRSLTRLVPKPIKTLVARQMKSMVMFLQGCLDSFSFGKILGFVKKQLFPPQQGQAYA